jgi:hypothetical protein
MEPYNTDDEISTYEFDEATNCYEVETAVGGSLAGILPCPACGFLSQAPPEQELVRLLPELGLVCSRVPLSGAAGGEFAGDIRLELLGRTRRVEVKARREFRTLQGWLGPAELLLLKANRQPPLVVVPLSWFAKLVTRP